MNLNVSCLQIDIAFGDPEANFKRAEQKIEQAIASKPDVLILPELWTTGYDLTRLDEIADAEAAGTKKFISDCARKFNVNIIAGSVAKKTSEGVTNTMLVFNRKGEMISEYSKLHLFKLMDEHHYLKPGGQSGLFELEGVPSMGLICYDIRFPEWVRAHTAKGAQVMFVSAEWPLPRIGHWRSLLLARAIENQCYVVACNRVGNDPNNKFGGHSIIIDPWGEILAEAGEDESILSASLDLGRVSEVRSQIPIFDDRRPEFYR